MPTFQIMTRDGSADPRSMLLEADNERDAKCEAMRVAREAFCTRSETAWSSAPWVLILNDASGVTLLRVEVDPSATAAAAY